MRYLLMMLIMRLRHLCEQHLHSLKKQIYASEKWVVLGDMLELGEDEQVYHESLANQIVTMHLEGIVALRPPNEMAI